jgi:hypothetical protein
VVVLLLPVPDGHAEQLPLAKHWKAAVVHAAAVQGDFVVLSLYMAAKGVHPGALIGSFKPASKLYKFSQPSNLPSELPQLAAQPWGPRGSSFVAGSIRLQGSHFVGSLAKPPAAATSFENAMTRHGLASATGAFVHQTVEQVLDAPHSSQRRAAGVCWLVFTADGQHSKPTMPSPCPLSLLRSVLICPAFICRPGRAASKARALPVGWPLGPESVAGSRGSAAQRAPHTTAAAATAGSGRDDACDAPAV